MFIPFTEVVLWTRNELSELSLIDKNQFNEIEYPKYATLIQSSLSLRNKRVRSKSRSD